MAAAVLRANNIAVWLQSDDCGGMYPSFEIAQGVRLLVRSEDGEAAKALLAAEPIATDNSVTTKDTAPIQSPRIKLALLQIAAGVVAGVLLCLLYQYMNRFRTETYQYDSNGDGLTDDTAVYKDGVCVRQTMDRNFDGKPDLWFSFDDQGRRKESQTDDNFDGRIDGVWTYTNGVLIHCKLDSDFNGITDLTEFFKNELVKEAVWRPNGSTVVSLRQFFRHGVLLEEWRDTNTDGHFDLTNSFDAFQNRIETNAFKLVTPKSY